MAADKEWQGRTDGTPWMHRWLIRVMRVLPLRLMYAGVAVFIVPFYMLFRRSGFRAQWQFFRQRMGYGRMRSLWSTYRNHCQFSQVVLDRFYMFGGGQFRLTADDMPLYRHLAAQPEGFVILSSHVGCYEVAGYTLQAYDKRFNALVYGGEAEAVLQNRRRVMEANNIHTIVTADDMSHVFLMSEALANGEVVSIPADRIYGSPRSIKCRFFGTEARFPLGPFALAAQRSLPVLQVSVMKEGYKHYRVFITDIASDLDATQPIRQRASVMAQRFAGELEAIVRRYPTQWYNYFDFWAS
ncbi:MAG: acyltransferase [Prevotella sp.]|nr:acyltransferase [Prevotella sp.]